ncbi:hypothetical protein [Caulobacter sp. RL271]|uniref:Uncharacterized protein n=1 Tax=Caulobacter segnis TaxID=88688 RepID=A0ABY4ZT77_9CAUL|nr:hypothetical protein [Caulobacter segnis]USQ95136.1 hypothetical protein MZV50_21670 [Caulobacter segnis]
MNDLSPHQNELTPHQKDAIGRAAHLRREVSSFQDMWPRLNSAELLPPITWSELERQLMNLALTPTAAAMVPDLVAATRKQASFKPNELVMREILCIASAVMDETFLSDSSSSDLEEDDPII